MKAIIKYLSVTVLTLLCSAAWSIDFEEEFKKILKDGVQKKIEEKSDAATSSALLGLVGISQEDEITIGRQIAGNLLGASALVKDQGLQSYVNNVGRWVASQSERPDLAWHFGVIESSDVNAFAAPGGYIFLTRGLYSLLQNEAELAGVLGHEIGHVIRKHHLKILQQSSLVDLGGKLLSKRIGGNDKVQKLIGNGAEIVARSLDKNAEFEADRIAVVLASRAGYDAFALPEVLQKIGHFANDDGSVALLFKTHPLPDDRLEKLGLVMNDRLEDVKGKTLVVRFYRIKP
ncbi:MAG: M48 family metalloprotease [Candidatus Nitrotoga sp.]